MKPCRNGPLSTTLVHFRPRRQHKAAANGCQENTANFLQSCALTHLWVASRRSSANSPIELIMRSKRLEWRQRAERIKAVPHSLQLFMIGHEYMYKSFLIMSLQRDYKSRVRGVTEASLASLRPRVIEFPLQGQTRRHWDSKNGEGRAGDSFPSRGSIVFACRKFPFHECDSC